MFLQECLKNLSRLFLVIFLLVCCGCDKFYELRKHHYYEKGKKLYEDGEYFDAAKEFSNALAFDPKYFDALYMRGICFYKQGMFKNARGSLQKAISVKPERLDARFMIIKVLFAVGAINRYYSGYVSATEILEIDPHNDEAMFLKLKGQIKSRDNAFVSFAEDEIDLLLNQDCDDFRIYCLIAEIEILRGKLTEAEELLKQYYSAGEDWTSTMMFLAERYKSEWENEKFAEIYEEIIDKAEDKYPYQKVLAEFFRQTEEVKKEERLLKEMMKSYPDFFQIRLSLIDFLIYYERLEEAEGLILTETEKAPENLNLKKMLVKIYGQRGKIEKAIEMAKQMLAAIEEDSSRNLEIKNIIAELHFQYGNYELSKSVFREVLNKNPMNTQARFNFCKIQLKEGAVIPAVGVLRQLASENPNDPKYYYHLGLAHELAGEEIMAAKAFCDSLDVSHGYKDALLKISDIYMTKGYYSELRSRIKNYLKQRPKDKEMLSLLKKVESKVEDIL